MPGALIAAALIPAGLSLPAAQPGAPFEATVQADIAVPMRDGVLRALDLYRPARAGQPVAERLPAQPYTDGQVGSWGNSYEAHTQADSSKTNPPHLKTRVGSRAPCLPLNSRRDVLVLQTAPLEADTTVIGPIEARLFVASTAVDADFTAKLVDVYPPSADFPTGFEMNLTDALQRASFRDNRLTRSLVTPGQVYELTIRPFATANGFKRGHRIRLDISEQQLSTVGREPEHG